ncbi:lanthionine synthetase LanC family protein [Rhizohabitans arisaemae]|uniref:lanthionine synthetase LanC family protein n=1 Tax=Rhizohabitans arisaemae TaxID=2720610 RepID=UPI0024B1095B|nr:lanthionine synthetase LanC family protein [Rhizohabitans arisaemae]
MLDIRDRAAVLALLSLAALNGAPPPGAAEAIERMCDWVDLWKQDQDDPWWPGYVTHDRAERPRPSWCYGIAGIARAQLDTFGDVVDTRAGQLSRLLLCANVERAARRTGRVTPLAALMRQAADDLAQEP